MATGDTTLKALMDAGHYATEIDPGTQFKVYDRVRNYLLDEDASEVEENALEHLIDIIVADLMIALSENIHTREK